MEFDGPTSTLANFAISAISAELPDEVVRAVVRHHYDSIGCALGAVNSTSSRIARAIAQSAATASHGASVFGLKDMVAPEQAAFANVTMVRELDFNDNFNGEAGSGHLSDMIPAVVAAAEYVHASGFDVIRGIYVAYEVYASLTSAYPFREAGWDHAGTFAAVGTATGASVVFGLTPDQLSNAISMAITPSIALTCTRNGEVSNWKTCASAHGAMTGLFAARLAREGMSGPKAPFEGIGGLHQQVLPKSDIQIGQSPSAVERASFKQYPAVGGTQDIIGPLLVAGGKISADQIEKISIATYAYAWKIIGGGSGDADKADKWNPKTRETADHSMPYIVAVSLLDGEVTPDSFSPERLGDPRILSLLRKISIEPREDLTVGYPAQRKTEITIDLTSGEQIDVMSHDPVGTPRNPMSDDQLSDKFNGMSRKVLSSETSLALEGMLWNLRELNDLNELTTVYLAIVVS